MRLFEGFLRARFVAAVAVLLMSAGAAVAEDAPLRWKLEKGMKLDYKQFQVMKVENTGTIAGQSPNVSMEQELEMTWDVTDMKDGVAEIQLKIVRAKLKMTLPPPNGAIEYDSASEKLPVGPAAMLAPMYKAMMQSAFTIKMTQRGEITDVKIPEDIVKALKNSQGGAMSEMADEKGFKKMISDGLLVLPEEAPKTDAPWTTTFEVTDKTSGGKQLVERTYTYIGTKEVEGKKLAEFKSETKMKFEGTGVKIKDQSSVGEILFNIADGRLDSTTVKQQVTIEQPNKSGETKIVQDSKVNVAPAGEKSAEEKKPEEKSEKPAEKAAQ